MPHLSFDKENDSKARAIARFKGGKHDNEILYLHDSNGSATANPIKKKTFQRSRYLKFLDDMKPNERTKTMIRLEEAYHNGKTLADLDERSNVKAVYEKMLKDAENNKMIELDDEAMFELLPSSNPNTREVWYICGQSGSGKSYIAKTLANYYHKLFPERGVYLVSKLNKDETLDALKFIKRVNIQSFVDDYPTLEEFQDCMLICDDYDTLTGEAEKVISKIIDDIAIQGRHTNTTMLCLSHYLSWGMSN